MDGVRGGMPPKDVTRSAGDGSNVAEKGVRSGGDPFNGAPGPSKGVAMQPRVAAAGAAPVAGMSAPGAGKLDSDNDNQRAQIGRRGFAMGGKINRHGTAVPPGGGNGGVKGGNAPIPLKQPDGMPSTGVTAGGTLPMDSATLGKESKVAPTAQITSSPVQPKLRAAAVKRVGRMPSLPRMRR